MILFDREIIFDRVNSQPKGIIYFDILDTSAVYEHFISFSSCRYGWIQIFSVVVVIFFVA